MSLLRSPGYLLALFVSLGPLPGSISTASLPLTLIAEMFAPQAAQAQSAEAVARVAKAITVRIEGSGSPGSGVLVKREGNRYTVLTAWHVVSGQRPGEELAVITSDGQQHQFEQGSIGRLGGVDMALLVFSSPKQYEVAKTGQVAKSLRGSQVFVAGFPATDKEELRFAQGRVVANANVGIDQGYQLLYTNETVSGMSGGVILNEEGLLVGLHGRGELDQVASDREKRMVKTGINQGVPITYYNQYMTGSAVAIPATLAEGADDFLAQAYNLLYQTGRGAEVVALADKSLKLQPSSLGYFIRGSAKYFELKNVQDAINDMDLAVAMDPLSALLLNARGAMKFSQGATKAAILDFDKALAIEPQFASAFLNRGFVKDMQGDKQAALSDYTACLVAEPHEEMCLWQRAVLRQEIGDRRGALEDVNKAISINNSEAPYLSLRAALKFRLGDNKGAISDLNSAILIDPRNAESYYTLGLVRLGLGDLGGAIIAEDQALALNPRDSRAYFVRGEAKSKLGDKTGSIADLNLAIAYDSRNASAYFRRATVRYELRDRQGAIQDLGQAIALKPNADYLYLYRGAIYLESGDHRNGCTDLRTAASMGLHEASALANAKCQ